MITTFFGLILIQTPSEFKEMHGVKTSVTVLSWFFWRSTGRFVDFWGPGDRLFMGRKPKILLEKKINIFPYWKGYNVSLMYLTEPRKSKQVSMFRLWKSH
jgi:hypothetical protein